MKTFIKLYPFILVALVITMGISSSSCGRESLGLTAPPDRGAAIDVYDEFVVLYGDPHVHTVLSDGDESPDFAIRYARNVSGLDWVCLSDHAEMMAGDNWVGLEYYRSIPEKYNEDGEFSVLFGYEWTNPVWGHRNVYTTDNSVPVLSSYSESADTPNELWERLAMYDVITIPHHPAITTTEHWWSQTNPEVDTCIEFYSKWGNSLYDGVDNPVHNSDPANTVFEALSTHGLKFGIMAATDTHMTRPGSVLGESRPNGTLEYSHPGLTAVWAASNTPGAIFEALKNRQCYGMSGTKIRMEFVVDGAIMGSEITAEASPELEYEFLSETIIDNIRVMKIHGGIVEEIDNIDIHTKSYGSIWIDDGFVEDSAYFLIADLVNGDMGVTSPVWVEFVHSGSAIF